MSELRPALERHLHERIAARRVESVKKTPPRKKAAAVTMPAPASREDAL
jgi:hypothetical protein